MTSRERVIAAVQGGIVDRQPNVSWLGEAGNADVVVQPIAEVAKGRPDDPFVLADIKNPFGLALGKGIDLNKALKDDPSVGAVVLDNLVEEVRDQIRTSLNAGADGIFYRLHGASPVHCTPMQYGGHYLERDRELLREAQDSALNVVFVVGKEELYIDFVSDLPAHVFAWDYDLSHLTASQIRLSRPGAVASSDPSSEMRLIIGRMNYLETLEQPYQEQPNIG